MNKIKAEGELKIDSKRVDNGLKDQDAYNLK
jgi:hypothetical protein